MLVPSLPSEGFGRCTSGRSGPTAAENSTEGVCLLHAVVQRLPALPLARGGAVNLCYKDPSTFPELRDA